jgi:phosphohistidine phosphatase
MAGTLGRPRTTYLDELYEAEASALAAAIRRAPAGARRLMLIGHNPGLEDLAQGLIASGDRDGRKALAEKFPTAALAVIDFDIETWRDLAPATGRLTLFMIPKRLP